MKKLLILFVVVLTIVSCKRKDKNKFDDSVPKTHQELYGNWIGSFKAEKFKEGEDFSYYTKINIKITGINSNNQVQGLSIVAGNKVPFEGTYNEAAMKFILKEMGNNKYNGVFEFSIVGKDSAEGLWNANDSTIIVTQRTFSIHKKEFIYNQNLMLPEPEEGPYKDYVNVVKKTFKNIDSTDYSERAYRSATDAVIKINASTTQLMEDSLKNLKKLDLEIIRNTIYARHGFTFSSRVARQFFDEVEWYVPISDNVEHDLTPLEKKNIALLQRFEKYAEDNYDTFGR